MTIQRLNYTTRAIPDLYRMAEALTKASYPASSAIVLYIATLLDESEKFILPKGGHLFDFKGYKETDFDLFQPPYPAIAAEFVTDQTQIRDNDRVMPPKTIAFTFDYSKWFEDTGQGQSLLLGSVYFNPELDHWVVYPCGLRIDLPIEPIAISAKERQTTRNEIEQNGSLRDRDLRLPDTNIGHSPKIVPLGEAGIEHMNAMKQIHGTAMAGSLIRAELAVEEVAIFQLFGALNCENVGIERIEPPKFMARKRARGGKKPLYDYKVLEVSVPKQDFACTPGSGGGTPKRAHMRRGHIRRYQSGKAIWIQPQMVGDSQRGFVDKDYAINVK